MSEAVNPKAYPLADAQVREVEPCPDLVDWTVRVHSRLTSLH